MLNMIGIPLIIFAIVNNEVVDINNYEYYILILLIPIVFSM